MDYRTMKTILLTFAAMLVVLLGTLSALSVLRALVKVEAVQLPQPLITEKPLSKTPDTVLTTVYYGTEDSVEIAEIYIEIFHTGSNTVSYMKIPSDTRVTLSEELYKSLQTYAPELPQYLKLSKMAENFSKEYCFVGSNRILSELVGVTLTEYVQAEKDTLEKWINSLQNAAFDDDFFSAYTDWLAETASGRSIEERWVYYESRKKIQTVLVENAPGTREKDGYRMNGKQAGERIKQLILKPVGSSGEPLQFE